jgi:voltage-gated potassium channel
MLKAGATAVVSPTQIGGRRMASELIRPEVNEFLDQMLRDKDKSLRLEEVVIPKNSPYIGHMLREAPIRRETNLLVIAVRQPTREFVYNPEPDFVLEPGMTLVVMGAADGVKKLRTLVTPA